MELIDSIPIDLDPTTVKAKLKAPDLQSITELTKQALSMAEPRAVFTAAYIEKKDDDQVVIEGQCFKSRVLRKNLDDVGRVFPAVVTIGSRSERGAPIRGHADPVLPRPDRQSHPGRSAIWADPEALPAICPRQTFLDESGVAGGLAHSGAAAAVCPARRGPCRNRRTAYRKPSDASWEIRIRHLLPFRIHVFQLPSMSARALRGT